MVHGIVASHHGHICVRSELGRGTTFDIDFPITTARLANPDAICMPVEPARGSGQRVMYIDDGELMLLMMGHLLERLGYRATCLAGACVALATLRARPDEFDTVVTDYSMPAMSGLEFALALRERAKNLPIAVRSGVISDDMLQAFGRIGVHELMRKGNTLDAPGPLLRRMLPHCS